jgi:transposase, IS30 family
MATYKRLTQPLRYRLQALLELKTKQEDCALALEVSQATISREIARFQHGYPNRSYEAELAQQAAWQAKQRTPYKLHSALKEYVDEGLRKDWSPDQIAGTLEDHTSLPSLHHETIYRYVYAQSNPMSAHYNSDKEALISHLRIRHKKRYKSRGQPASASKIPNRVGIEERPAVVETNTEPGHWEGDLIVGANQQGYLLTLVERVSKFVLIFKLSSKHAKDVSRQAAKALWKSGLSLKTLTFDNGLEFADHGYLSSQLGIDIYFARPYHSWERGLNENTNGLIRQYFPKGTNFLQVSQKAVSSVQDQLNHRPRKTLHYRTPAQVALA